MAVYLSYVCLSVWVWALRYEFTCRLFGQSVILMSVCWGWVERAACRVAAATEKEPS